MELKSFALTLQFYSAKAYEFVRQSFSLGLPHQRQIRRWYSKIPAEPGFTEPAFQALQIKADEARDQGKEIVCSLMLDEMAIRKHVSWDGQKFRGYVDIGNDVEDDSSAIAKDALVFMVVNINGSWKVPCAYFLTNGMTGEEHANLVKICIHRLSDVGIKVVSLTFDGPSCHFTMLSEPGASLVPSNLDPSFPHPSNNQGQIHAFLDVCHMLKLVRNTLATWPYLLDAEANKISWKYLEELQKLQDSQGLHLGNKLKATQIKRWEQKMKVDLAAQTLSASVADALTFCLTDLEMPQFKGSNC